MELQTGHARGSPEPSLDRRQAGRAAESVAVCPISAAFAKLFGLLARSGHQSTGSHDEVGESNTSGL